MTFFFLDQHRTWRKVDQIETMTFFFSEINRQVEDKWTKLKILAPSETDFAPLRTTFWLRHCLVDVVLPPRPLASN